MRNMASRKVRSKQIMKAYNTVVHGNGDGNTTKQKQVPRLEKIHLEVDEFTEHNAIKVVLQQFIEKAQAHHNQYQIRRSIMIQEVAANIEKELIRVGKPQLICYISQELYKILKWCKIPWNRSDIIRALPQRYKDPTNRANALARQRYPGVPEDTGKMAEELEKQLNRKAPVGQYIVKCNLEYIGKHGLATLVTTKETKPLYKSVVPVIIRVNAAEQTATVEVDKETYNDMLINKSPDRLLE